ncbi:hybrid sensor histidine kinase/response regulator [Chitinophaga arvensicola]|uniref:histidine kinase n=1 Tax=Chitinophaga arvensicola TaxID=29529 RepID=A0A1I0RRJ2_9BACT|nr:hybrid sensor histidine kinase/response regulator [Chitinophaga arvensicola]SEW43409.1 Signal transduction histidine kinase [Chitinophaga arvensicola]
MHILNTIKTAGTQHSSESEKRTIIIINSLAFLTSMLVFALGGVFYLLVNSLLILLPLLLEGIGMLAVIALNGLGKKDAANFTLFALHYLAAGYWTTLLGNAIPIEVVIAFLLIFLICGSFLVYRAHKVRIVSLVAIAVLLVLIQANTYFGVIRPMDISPTSAYIMRLCTTGGMLTFILFVIIQFMKEINRLMDNLNKSNNVLAMNAAFLRETFHELKTPLNSIYGIAQLLELARKENKQVPVMEEIGPDLKNLLAASQLSKNIVNNVLDLKRIEAGKFLEIKINTLHLRNCLEECMAMNQYTGNLHGVKIRLRYDLPELHIESDELILTKIINNLTSNAVKFSPPNGQVEIHVNRSGQLLCLRVMNEGVIAPERMEKLFHAFESERNHIASGTGIGLHLTRQLITLLEGDIRVMTTDQHTIFECTVPFKAAPPQKTTEKKFELKKNEFEGLKVLIVDDNEMNQYVIRQFVSKGGAHTILKANGQEALEAALSEKPDIIITDSQMPVMSGKEFLLQLRAQPGFADTPFIVISGDAFNKYSNEAEDLLRAGAHAYFNKPFSFEDLYTEMIKHLPAKSVTT